jgi:Xaa-Pro aminopeptidase
MSKSSAEISREFPIASWDIAAPGVMAVDWEQRVDYQRMREYRVARAKESIARHGLGAVLVFDLANIRYLTSTVVGAWSVGRMMRYALLTGNGSPHIWDFGSAAKVHRMLSPWIDPTQSRGGNTGLLGSISPKANLATLAAQELKSVLEEEGVADMPIGVDVAEISVLRALEAVGLNVVDGQQAMLDARKIKNRDEIMVLSQACAMVDGVYQTIYEELKPGVRESDIVAMATKQLHEMGSEFVYGINSIAGERCNPHPHVFSDRYIRPGDQAYFDIVHQFNGYTTCYYRTFAVGRGTTGQRDAYKQCREWIDVAIDKVRPGVGTDEIARLWPTAEELGFANEMEAFGLQFGHGIGLSVHERPIISRLNSFDDPVELEVGMVFALETFCAAKDGRSAARIEEMVVCTEDGAKILTLFPAEELMVTNEY